MHFQNFITVLAWISAPLSGILLLLRYLGHREYHNTAIGRLRQSLDAFEGRRRIFPMKVPGAIFLLSVCWLIASHMK